tara:strand:- start:16 stop:1182 length:1167 start_codon:yes stop_codon:yes gene_type:complete
MSWGRFKLSKIANIIMGQSPESKFFNFSGEGIPFMQGKTEFGEIYPTISKYTTKTTRIASENSILFTVRAPVGSLNIANQEICIGRGLAAINSNDGNNSFLYYLLKNNTKILLSQSGEGVYDSINKTNLLNVELFIPLQIEKRNKIGHILSAYDDLIENNLKRIKLLEQAAQNIYKEWFINMRFPGHENTPIDQETGLPDGWTFEKFSDIAGFSQGLQVPTNKQFAKKSKGQKRFIRIVDVTQGGQENRYVDCSNSKYEIEKKDLFMIRYGSPMVVMGYEGVIANNFFRIEILEDVKMKNNFLFSFLNRDSIKNLLMNYSSSATMPAISFKRISKMEILNPSFEVQKKFSDLYNYKFDLIQKLKSQNEKLKLARDILLPRLMNQTIEV